jgi:geranylgeranyl diphosphate synthase type I
MKDIGSYGPSLQTKIRKTIASEQAKPDPVGSWRPDFFKRLLPYATGGKLIRGCLLCFAYEAFSGNKPRPEVMDSAVALELIHSGLLIHDDVMDDDVLRRGRPSIHSQYRAFAERNGLAEPARFGANTAICGADTCLFMALRLLAETPPAIAKLFGDILTEVCDGQMQDIYSQARSDIPSKTAIYNLMRAKTATYTLSLPLAAGAILAGQPDSVISKLRRIGDSAGIVFQIRDDELGVMGTTAKTGKPVGADIREGKKTLIYYYLMKKCTVMDRRRLREIFGNPSIGQKEVKIVQDTIGRREIRSLINTDVMRLENRALGIIETLDLPSRRKTQLRSLIAFCAKRQA